MVIFYYRIVFAIYNYLYRWYNQDMENITKRIEFNMPNGKKKVETLWESLPLPPWAGERLKYSVESFYASGNAPSQERINRFLKNNGVSVNNELVLNPNVLLHFSSGYTSINTVCDILQNGLKCFERNATQYANFGKAVNESNYVVDTWQLSSTRRYADFARYSPKYGVGHDLDREDLERHYAPAFRATDYTASYIEDMKNGLIYRFNRLPKDIQKNIDGRALQSIGFIIDGNELDEEKWLDDIYQNEILQRTFCGPALSHTKVKDRYALLRYNNGKVESLGKYGIASFLYGIPGDQILGIVSTYGMLLSDELCKEIFYNGGGTRFIVSPTGQVLYTPDNTMSIDDRFKGFLQNRDNFMLENVGGYDKIMADRSVCQANGTTWSREATSTYKSLMDFVTRLSSRRSEREVKPSAEDQQSNLDSDDTMES